MKNLFRITLLSFLLCLITTNNRADGGLLELGGKILKTGAKFTNTVLHMKDKAQQVIALEQLLEDLACTKYRFDKYHYQLNANSCLLSSRIKLIDLEYSTIYLELANAGMYLLTNTDPDSQSKFADLMKRVTEITDKMNSMSAEQQKKMEDKLINDVDNASLAALATVQL